jgi:hypothetical protein
MRNASTIIKDGLLDLVMATPDWIECIVCCDSDEKDQLDSFIDRVGGRVHPAWRFDIDEERERIEGMLLAARGRSLQVKSGLSSGLSIDALRGLADRLAVQSRVMYEQSTEHHTMSCFSAQAIRPLPAAVTDLGGPESVAAILAMMRLWGTSAPLRRVTALSKDSAGLLKRKFGPVRGRYRWAVTFHAADWAPTPLIKHLSATSPGIKVRLATTL